MPVGEDSQAVTTDGTPVLQDIAAIFGLHPLAEAMDAQAASTGANEPS